MIISVSRRTDVAAFYGEWFINRLRAGLVWVANPFNRRQVSEVSLAPSDVDMLVFWTKNPAPFLRFLPELTGYEYYFQFTLTPYGRDIEPHLPPKEALIATFHELSRRVGRERVVWRYDPIVITSRYDVTFHLAAFERMAARLAAYTDTCVISFVDVYPQIAGRLRAAGIAVPGDTQVAAIAAGFATIATRYGLRLKSCAERYDLSAYGIAHGACIDGRRIERLLGGNFTFRRDANQRPECGCASSVDIGAYSTCPHGCTYCYATKNPAAATNALRRHDPTAPLLTGQLLGDERITRRAVERLARVPAVQLDLFTDA